MIAILFTSILVSGSASAATCGDAVALYEHQHFTAAAAGFECRWRTEHAPKDLYWAAVSRTRAGNRSTAAQLWSEYFLIHDADPGRRERGRVQFADLVRHLRKVRITARARDSDEPVVLRLVPSDLSVERPALTLTMPPRSGKRTLEVLLEPGAWSMVAHHDELILATQISPGTASLHLDLAPLRHRGLLAASIIGGSSAVGGGATLAYAAPRVEAMIPGSGCAERDLACLISIRDTLAVRDVGIGLVSASLPIILSGAISVVSDRRRRRILWVTEFGIGALVTAGGAALIVHEARQFERGFHTPPADEATLTPLRTTGRAIGAALVGLGAGAIGGAGMGLVFESRGRGGSRTAVNVGPRVNAMTAGVELGLRF